MKADSTEHSPPDEELEVLRLVVVEGLTDRAVARRLGVALITVRRRIHRFMERVGAKSRIQAAAIAAERGWLRVHEKGDGPPGTRKD